MLVTAATLDFGCSSMYSVYREPRAGECSLIQGRGCVLYCGVCCVEDAVSLSQGSMSGPTPPLCFDRLFQHSIRLCDRVVWHGIGPADPVITDLLIDLLGFKVCLSAWHSYKWNCCCWTWHSVSIQIRCWLKPWGQKNQNHVQNLFVTVKMNRWPLEDERSRLWWTCHLVMGWSPQEMMQYWGWRWHLCCWQVCLLAAPGARRALMSGNPHCWARA